MGRCHRSRAASAGAGGEVRASYAVFAAEWGDESMDSDGAGAAASAGSGGEVRASYAVFAAEHFNVKLAVICSAGSCVATCHSAS